MKNTQEFLIEHFAAGIVDISDVKQAMIGFAKMHVEAALKAAKEVGNDFEGNETMNESILNSYPLSNIK
jgi:hypothetical protein